jgi:plastocyanin
MRFSSVIAIFAVVATASARQIDVLVGNNGSLTFVPSSVTAAVGDVMAFTL